MVYEVVVDCAPAHELVVSLWAYAGGHRKTLALDARWAERVRRQVPASLAAAIKGLQPDSPALPLPFLVWQCPAPRDVAGFLHWLAGLPPGELYERAAPYLDPGRPPLPADLAGLRDQTVALLSGWHEAYFRHCDPAIAAGLAADAAAKQALVGRTDPVDLVELATGGVRLEPAPPLHTVVLVPQYHHRPYNLVEAGGGVAIYLYPVDALPPAPGEPAPALLRLTAALADPSRLRILRFLAAGSRSFTEVVQHTGLAKSTVSHHMVTLRAAGLVRLQQLGDLGDRSAGRYSLRPAALAELSEQLSRYLSESEEQP